MNRSAKEAKKAKDEKKYATTVDEALGRLKDSSAAVRVLGRLQRVGFDEKRIAELVLLYCGGDPRTAEQGRRQVESYSNQLQDCGERLNSLASSVEAIQKLCNRFGRWFHDDDLPRRMRQLAVTLLRAAEIQEKGLRQMRLGSSDQAGRDWVLVYLAYFLSGEDKPSKETYKTIAAMVAAVTRRNPDLISTTDRLRQAATRFLKARNSDWVVQSAKAEFMEQKLKFSRSTP